MSAASEVVAFRWSGTPCNSGLLREKIMQIYGVSQLHGAQAPNAPHNARLVSNDPVARSHSTSDQLDISEAAQLAAKLADIPDIRQDRVASIRAAIENGTYETADKLNTAVDRLLDEIG
jgi:flagellar biosynthesis anti-sigma factor FlgM